MQNTKNDFEQTFQNILEYSSNRTCCLYERKHDRCGPWSLADCCGAPKTVFCGHISLGQEDTSLETRKYHSLLTWTVLFNWMSWFEKARHELLLHNECTLEASYSVHGNIFSINDWELPTFILEGISSFSDLIREMIRFHITGIFEEMNRVSMSRIHQKHLYLTVKTMSPEDLPIRHPDTDGRDNLWESIALLNYRRGDTWN